MQDSALVISKGLVALTQCEQAQLLPEFILGLFEISGSHELAFRCAALQALDRFDLTVILQQVAMRTAVLNLHLPTSCS